MRRLAFLVTLLMVLTGCGGGNQKKPEAPKAACSPSGTSLAIIAKATSFAKECLAAPAGKAFTIELDNQDADTHNVAIYRNKQAQDKLFGGEIFAGPKKMTYNVNALAAGTYFFRCDVHPEQMTGTFVVA